MTQRYLPNRGTWKTDLMYRASGLIWRHYINVSRYITVWVLFDVFGDLYSTFQELSQKGAIEHCWHSRCRILLISLIILAGTWVAVTSDLPQYPFLVNWMTSCVAGRCSDLRWGRKAEFLLAVGFQFAYSWVGFHVQKVLCDVVINWLLFNVMIWYSNGENKLTAGCSVILKWPLCVLSPDNL